MSQLPPNPPQDDLAHDGQHDTASERWHEQWEIEHECDDATDFSKRNATP